MPAVTISDKDWMELDARLRGFIARRVANDSDAEEILQDSYRSMQQNIDTLKDETRFESWLYQIVRNRIIDYYRRRTITPLDMQDLPQPEADNDVLNELSPCLLSMLKLLDHDDQEALHQVHLQQQSVQQYADNCGLSLSAAKSRVQRARSKIRNLFETCCDISYNQRGEITDMHQDKPCSHCGEQAM